jgi:integral membrane protein (TIGR00529 family)
MEREVIALAASILLIIDGVRLKLDLGISMILGAACLSLVAGKSASWTAVELGRAAVEPDTLLLLARVAAITALGALAGKLGYLDRFVAGLRAFIGDNRIVLALIPAFGGLLPMPGGAMLTAPMVETASARGHVSGEQKFFVNYWFRHVWEYIWPLYPGVVFGASILSRNVGDLFSANYPLTIAAIAGGYLFVLRKVDAGRNERSGGRASDGRKDLLVGVWPFAVVIAGVLVFKLELSLVVCVVIAALAVMEKAAARDLWAAMRRGLEFQIVSLVVGVGAYKGLLTATKAVEAVPPFFMELHLPELFVIAAVPMIVGLITGVTLAFIAVSFPILLPLLGGADLDMRLVMLAYASGFVGCLLSPVHLCLVLSREYFRANLGRSYRLLALPCALIMLVAVAIALL